jgi:hypothetical protein
MTAIFAAVIAFFQQEQWSFDHGDQASILRTVFDGANGRCPCYVHTREADAQFVFYSVLPVNVPPPRQAAVVEFITRANYGMNIGNFEFNYDDGEVRYKTSVDVEGSDLAPALVKQLVYANVTTMDLYLPGFMELIYADAKPLDVLRKIERDDQTGADLAYGQA